MRFFLWVIFVICIKSVYYYCADYTEILYPVLKWAVLYACLVCMFVYLYVWTPFKSKIWKFTKWLNFTVGEHITNFISSTLLCHISWIYYFFTFLSSISKKNGWIAFAWPSSIYLLNNCWMLLNISFHRGILHSRSINRMNLKINFQIGIGLTITTFLTSGSICAMHINLVFQFSKRS